MMTLEIPQHIEYITKTDNLAYVQIPAEEWEAFLASVKRQTQYEKMKVGLKQGLAEVRAMQAGKLKETTMEEFLESL
jgi:hypothetical protein